MDLAWDPAADAVTLPVYYSWRFATGADGDFESLVRQLHGVPLPPGLGSRRLVLDYPLSGLPAPDADGGSALELQVALRPPGSDAGRYPAAGRGELPRRAARRAWSTPATTSRC